MPLRGLLVCYGQVVNVDHPPMPYGVVKALVVHGEGRGLEPLSCILVLLNPEGGCHVLYLYTVSRVPLFVFPWLSSGLPSEVMPQVDLVVM